MVDQVRSKIFSYAFTKLFLDILRLCYKVVRGLIESENFFYEISVSLAWLNLGINLNRVNKGSTNRSGAIGHFIISALYKKNH